MQKELEKNPNALDSLNDNELSDVLRLIKHRLRAICKKDLYFLAKYILGFTEMDWDFHKEICDLVQAVNPYIPDRFGEKPIPSNIRNRLWLIFRGSFKTSVITQAHIVQLILIDPNIRICLASNKLASAKEMLTVIKNVFMLNQLFRFIFPEYCPTANEAGKIEWGTSEQVTVPNRTNITLKESTIECAGVDTGLISRHYDYLKKDDLVTDKSVTTEEQIKASIDWDRSSNSLFDIPEKGFCDWVGTRYDDRDLYGVLEKRPKDKISIYVKPIYNEFGEINFSSRFSAEGIADLRENQGEYIFSCQYLLNPVAQKDQKFKPEWVNKNFYLSLPDLYAISILVDPAAKRKKSSKYTAMVVHAIEKKTWHVIDGVFDKLSVTDRVNSLFELAYRHRKNLRLVTYETIGFQESDQVYLERKMREEEFFFHITPVEGLDSTKNGRIEGLVPFYEYGKIRYPNSLSYYSTYHNRKIDLVEVAKYELFRFPKCEHLDWLDAQSQQLKFPNIFPLRATRKPKIKPGSFNWYRQKMINYKKNPLSRFYKVEEVFEKVRV